jgi:DNA mismatch repair protein MutL
MASTIQLLPSEVVHLLAATEVIDSLASVVRELAENSLDAGATRITIFLWQSQWRVRVADNGYGMHYEDLLQAATAHSTSKIHDCADLWKISSLGFRGEALHSLSTLGDVEISSRQANPCLSGWRVIYGDNGKVIEVETVAMAPGTVVTVSNIFAKWSGRRQGLVGTQQLKAVQQIIQQISLCHPHVTWQIYQDDRRWFTISPGNTMGQILAQLLSQVHQSDLQEVNIDIPHPPNFPQQISKSSLNLVLGLPDRCHRHRPDWIRCAVNRRMVKLPEMEQTIFSRFHQTLPRYRYPICLLHLNIPSEFVDGHRNPSKSEIYLKELAHWQEQVSLAIEQGLRINPSNTFDAYQTKRAKKLLKSAEENAAYNLISGKQSELKSELNQISPNSTPTPHYLKAIAQVHNTYIVVEHPGGLWLVEQHIAHERVIYEEICKTWKLIPIEPAVILYQLSDVQVERLQAIGLDIETFGEQLWAIRNIPAPLEKREDIAQAILEISNGDFKAAQVAIACRTAIRNGKPLSLQQMQNLIDEWQRTANPHSCPHGRPICLSLKESSLARYFRRQWMIGN